MMKRPSDAKSLDALLARIRACRACAAHFSHEPRPVVRARPGARILIIGQAPGTKVHATGIPWNDASGDRLRDWMGLDRDTFYDESRVAVMPMGFCFPGQNATGGDLAPRRECAPLWHDALLAHLPRLELILLVGQYAQARYLGAARHKKLWDTVAHWRDYGPLYWPLPHPSWRNSARLRANAFFEAEVVPQLRRRIHALIA